MTLNKNVPRKYSVFFPDCKRVSLKIRSDGFSVYGQKGQYRKIRAWLPENVTTENLTNWTLPGREKPPKPIFQRCPELFPTFLFFGLAFCRFCATLRNRIPVSTITKGLRHALHLPEQPARLLLENRYRHRKRRRHERGVHRRLPGQPHSHRHPREGQDSAGAVLRTAGCFNFLLTEL